MPKIECDGFWKMLVSVVPPIQRHLEEGCLSRCGVSLKRRVYAKREVASASALSAEDNQDEAKVKSRRQARERNWRKTSIVGAERIDKEVIALSTASLST